jgi:radical SAM-linked protein
MTMPKPQPQPPSATSPPRYALVYRVVGDARYLSHHDELRMLVRALARARWPLAYSKGYNPQAKLKVPLPRRVGLAADGQVALVQLERADDPAALHAALAATLPAGFELRSVHGPQAPKTVHAAGVTFAVALTPEDAAAVAPRIAGVLAATTLVVERPIGADQTPRTVDVRPYVNTIEMDGTTLRLHLGVDAQQTARPEELLTKLELSPERYLHEVRRAEVRWDIALSGDATGASDIIERKTTGDHEENHQEEGDA